MTDIERLNNALDQRYIELQHKYENVDSDKAISQLIATEASQEFILMNILMASKDSDISKDDLIYIIFNAIDGLNIQSKAIIDFLDNVNLYNEERD